MTDKSPNGRAQAVGSVAEEAAKLLGALSDWGTRQAGADATPEMQDATDARQGWGSALASLTQLLSELDAHVAGENCTYCPLCRAVALVRSASPEVRDHLTAAGSSLVQAAMSALAPREGDRARSNLERIDLDTESSTDAGWD